MASNKHGSVRRTKKGIWGCEKNTRGMIKIHVGSEHLLDEGRAVVCQRIMRHLTGKHVDCGLH